MKKIMIRRLGVASVAKYFGLAFEGKLTSEELFLA